MCKHADNPCPGCKKHEGSETVWKFFTDEERARFDHKGKTDNPQSWAGTTQGTPGNRAHCKRKVS